MNSMKQLTTLMFVSVLMLLSVWGYGFERYVPGVHYAVNTSIEAPTDEGRVTVYEFFSYGCPHCASLAPLVSVFHRATPEFVKWERYPALWNERFVFYGGLYQAVKELGLEEQYHDRIFEAIHTEKTMTHSKESLLKWFASQGEETRALAGILEKPDQLAKKLSVVEAMYKRFRIAEVPVFIVDRRYLTSRAYAKSSMELMQILEFLVEKAARERKDVKS